MIKGYLQPRQMYVADLQILTQTFNVESQFGDQQNVRLSVHGGSSKVTSAFSPDAFIIDVKVIPAGGIRTYSRMASCII